MASHPCRTLRIKVQLNVLLASVLGNWLTSNVQVGYLMVLPTFLLQIMILKGLVEHYSGNTDSDGIP
jgi:hypothetical protein